jgi:hypothetical protein
MSINDMADVEIGVRAIVIRAQRIEDEARVKVIPIGKDRLEP